MNGTMTFDEFMRKVRDAFPGATIGEDNDGQLIIYTDLTERSDGTIVPFEEAN